MMRASIGSRTRRFVNAAPAAFADSKRLDGARQMLRRHSSAHTPKDCLLLTLGFNHLSIRA
jgi:hypothetical protein